MTTRGFLLGKFMPPHAGHQLLCDVARSLSDALTILVCSLEREPISGHLRHTWMSELYPDCRVLHLSRDMPQEPAEHPRFWDIWRDAVRELHPEPIDLVFASEPYGHRLGAELSARFVPVDPARLAVPISGTAVREDLLSAWSALAPPVRAHFARKVCLFGPESTGKTTLVTQLAQRFSTVGVPEYGRTYTDAFGVDCSADDLIRIAKGQQAMIASCARRSGPILFTDTDAVLTAVWATMLTGERPAFFEQDMELCSLYLLTDVDTPWVDDGTRYFPENAVRRQFFDACRSELERRGAPYVVIRGSYAERLAAAEAAVEEAFPREVRAMR